LASSASGFYQAVKWLDTHGWNNGGSPTAARETGIVTPPPSALLEVPANEQSPRGDTLSSATSDRFSDRRYGDDFS